MNKEILETCPNCEGDGREECCGGHMCPGTTQCSRCNGKGKVLPANLRKLKDSLKLIEEYE